MQLLPEILALSSESATVAGHGPSGSEACRLFRTQPASSCSTLETRGDTMDVPLHLDKASKLPYGFEVCLEVWLCLSWSVDKAS